MGLSYVHVDNGDGGFGQLRYKTWDVTWDSSYPTGGELVNTSQVGLSVIIGIQLLAALDATSAGIIPVFDFDAIKLMAMRVAGFTPAGTVAAPTFTGSALAAHSHALWVATGATDAAGARVNAASNSFAMNNAAASIAGIPAASGAAGGVVDITGGTPAGTNSAPAFTGTAVAAGSLIEVANAVSLSAICHRLMFIGS